LGVRLEPGSLFLCGHSSVLGTSLSFRIGQQVVLAIIEDVLDSVVHPWSLLSLSAIPVQVTDVRLAEAAFYMSGHFVCPLVRRQQRRILDESLKAIARQLEILHACGLEPVFYFTLNGWGERRLSLVNYSAAIPANYPLPRYEDHKHVFQLANLA